MYHLHGVDTPRFLGVRPREWASGRDEMIRGCAMFELGVFRGCKSTRMHVYCLVITPYVGLQESCRGVKLHPWSQAPHSLKESNSKIHTHTESNSSARTISNGLKREVYHGRCYFFTIAGQRQVPVPITNKPDYMPNWNNY